MIRGSRLIVPTLLIVLISSAGCSAREERSDAATDEPQTPALVRDEDAYFAALAEESSVYGIPSVREKALAWGDAWCNASRAVWEESGAVEGSRSADYVEGVSDLPDEVTYLREEAWEFLCPTLFPDNVKAGEVPVGIALGSNARKPKSARPDGPTFELAAELTLPGAGGGGDKEDGFARLCAGQGEHSDVVEGAIVRVFAASNGQFLAQGDLGPGVVKGPDCQFFLTVHDLPEIDTGYAFVIGEHDPVPFSLEDTREPITNGLSEGLVATIGR